MKETRRQIGGMKMIYLDNAATTMQKPEEVIQAVVTAMQSMGNAGRGAHSASLEASRTIYVRRKGSQTAGVHMQLHGEPEHGHQGRFKSR